MLRRQFLLSAALSPAARGSARLSSTERIDRALQGRDVDRPPFTLWHHFNLNSSEAHAQATLNFHRAYHTDLVKVMSDFPYPRPAGRWYDLKPVDNPFPQQLRALEIIRDALAGSAYFIETIFNPFNVAGKLSSKAEVLKLMRERPQQLLNALEVITLSEIHHARRALAAGASGILLAVANAERAELSPEDYRRFSAPFDKRIMEAVNGASLNVLHLHVERDYLPQFPSFPATAINYSQHVTGIPFAEMRKLFPNAVLMGGVDEVRYRTLTAAEIRAQWQAAAKAAGPKYILTPGCSVPNDSHPEELVRLSESVES
jgi:uroporphyrinogen decarboxylase